MDDLAKLRLYIDLRMYKELESYAESILKQSGWKELATQIRKVRTSGHELDPARPEKVRKGKVRDALVHLIDLYPVSGIDGDLLSIFKAVEADSLSALRSSAIPYAVESIRDQIDGKNNTFFLDVEAMATSVFAILVDDVVQSRRREIRNLPSEIAVPDLLSTYYGFNTLLSLLPHKSSNNLYYWDLSEIPLASENIEKMLKSLGAKKSVNLESSRIPYTTVFAKCSKHTAFLLAYLAKMRLAQTEDARNKAVKAIGDLGDSRADAFLISALEHSQQWKERTTQKTYPEEESDTRQAHQLVPRALAHIGSEVSGRIIFNHFSTTSTFLHAGYDLEAAYCLGHIRSKVSEKRLGLMVKASRRYTPTPVWGLGNICATSPSTLAILSWRLGYPAREDAEGVLKALLRMGDEGVQVIRDGNLDSVRQIAENSARPEELILGLQSICTDDELGRITAGALNALFLVEEMKRADPKLRRGKASSTPDYFLRRLAPISSIFVNREFLQEISRASHIDFAKLKTGHNDFLSELKSVVREELQRGQSVAGPMRVISSLPSFASDMELVELAGQVGRTAIWEILTSGDIKRWHWGLSADLFDSKEKADFEKLELLLRPYSITPCLQLTRFVADLSIYLRTADEIPPILAEVVAEKLDSADLYEAVLSGSLADFKVIVDAVLDNIDTTFVSILGRTYKYADWYIPKYLENELVRRLRRLKRDAPLCQALWARSARYPNGLSDHLRKTIDLKMGDGLMR